MEVLATYRTVYDGGRPLPSVNIILTTKESHTVMKEIHELRDKLPEGSKLAEMLEKLKQIHDLDPTLVRKKVKKYHNISLPKVTRGGSRHDT